LSLTIATQLQQVAREIAEVEQQIKSTERCALDSQNKGDVQES